MSTRNLLILIISYLIVRLVNSTEITAAYSHSGAPTYTTLRSSNKLNMNFFIRHPQELFIYLSFRIPRWNHDYIKSSCTVYGYFYILLELFFVAFQISLLKSS